MTEQAYPAARVAAAKVHPHFALRSTWRKGPASANASIPDVLTIEEMLSVAFWTSLRREEIYTPRLSLTFAAPTEVDRPMVFDKPVPFAPQALARLAPAVERPGIHLCVWRQSGELRVWGASDSIPEFSFVLEIVAPGLLVLKHSRGESGKFVNIAVLQGEEIRVVDQRAASAPDCPELLTSLLGLPLEFHAAAPVNALIQLAVSMRAHGRGGSLLVVPAGIEVWRESILQPIAYAVAPAFRSLAELMSEGPDERTRRTWRRALERVIDKIAGLTAVDGATILTNQYELVAFGAKIVRRPKCQLVDRVIVTAPLEGAVAEVAEPAQLGGTRHLSAAQFAHDQRDAIALVASQDGRFTVLGWSPCEKLVHAHRIETLLL